jgi:hypothetical protein
MSLLVPQTIFSRLILLSRCSFGLSSSNFPTVDAGGSLLYRVSQEGRSVFWEVIVSVILSKKLYMNMCPIPNGFRDRDI